MKGCRRLWLGKTEWEIGKRTYIMGILNVTPDSFSDGGRYFAAQDAVRRAQEMVAEGADIIDVGGHSTRPGHQAVPAGEELRRVLPVVERLAAELPVPICVDTFQAPVAEAALAAGAAMINDVWGLQADSEMAGVVASHGVPVVVMHNSDTIVDTDVMAAVKGFLAESIAIAERAGISRQQVIVDPGFGFGKSPQQNLEVVRRLSELQELACPILLGTSRKSTIGAVLGLPVAERLEGTAATVALAIAAGCDIVRVHDVRAMQRVARMTDAVVRGW